MGAEVLSDRAIQGMYYARLELGSPEWLDSIVMRIQSSQDSEEHKWLGAVPGFREWVGGRDAKTLSDFGVKIINKDFESTIEYHERELSEDKTGQLQIRLNEHVDQANYHDAEMVIDLLENGASKICYDGQYFFDTDHAEGASGTQSNKITVDISDQPVDVQGTPTNPSVPIMAAAIMKGITQILSFKNDQGKAVHKNARNFTVQVPISLFAVAQAAVANQVIDKGNTNTLATQSKFTITVEPVVELTWTDRFAIFRTDGSAKPFILQEREPVTVDYKGKDSDFYFDTRRIQVGLKKAGGIGYGLWQSVCQVILVA